MVLISIVTGANLNQQTSLGASHCKSFTQLLWFPVFVSPAFTAFSLYGRNPVTEATWRASGWDCERRLDHVRHGPVTPVDTGDRWPWVWVTGVKTSNFMGVSTKFSTKNREDRVRVREMIPETSVHTRWCPPVVSWFMNHSKYRYIYHKP